MSGLCAGSAERAHEAEDKAVALVERLRGRVTRDDTFPGKPVVKVQLLVSEITDADMKDLAALKTLTDLTLYSSQKLTAAGLKELATLTTLTALDLRHCTRLTDGGIKELQTALPKCKTDK